MGNFVRQRLLTPVHDWLMEVLRSLPQDGTFNQVRPLWSLRKRRPLDVFSFDLKSATDRWPVQCCFLFRCSLTSLGRKQGWLLWTLVSPIPGSLLRSPSFRVLLGESGLVVDNRWVITARGLYSRCPTIIWCGWQRTECTLTL